MNYTYHLFLINSRGYKSKQRKISEFTDAWKLGKLITHFQDAAVSYVWWTKSTIRTILVFIFFNLIFYSEGLQRLFATFRMLLRNIQTVAELQKKFFCN